MILEELKNRIESYPSEVMDFCLSEPFSWRGSYDEVCFSLNTTETSKKDNLKMINKALKETFHGWKGGEYRYNKNTTVNFEESRNAYSDGYYLQIFLDNNNNDAINHIFFKKYNKIANIENFMESDEDKFATEINLNKLHIKAPEGFFIGKITNTATGYLVEYIDKKTYNFMYHDL